MAKDRWEYVRSKEELEVLLGEQIAFLRASSAEYDRGTLAEAKRLSAHCYTLLHDGTGRTKSLLGQLGLTDKMQFISSAAPSNVGKDSWLPLCTVTANVIKRSAEFLPRLALERSKAKMIPFAEWWEEMIYDPLPELQLSRKNLIFYMRSQDGGAHVDVSISSEAYHRLSKLGASKVYYAIHGEALAFYVGDRRIYIVSEDPGPNASPPPRTDPKLYPVINGHLASVRQIAWELDESLKILGL